MIKRTFSFYNTILLLLLAGICLSGCVEKKKEQEYLIGFSQCVGSDLWRKNMLEEMKMELSLHSGTRFIYKDADGNSKRQVEQVKQMLEQRVDLLIISPNEAQPLTPVVEEAYRKGIPVIVIDRKTSSDLYTAYVGADNYQIGKMAGEYLGTSLKARGNVIEIMGLPGSSPTIERQRGFADGIRKFEGLHISKQVYGDWLKENAEVELLKIKPELKTADIVFAHNDVMASGARRIIDQLQLNRSVKIIGIDALPGKGAGLEMVGNGLLNASVLYPTGGKEAISTAFKILNKEPFSKDNILGSLVIDASNVELMKLQWNKISSQQKDIERQQTLLDEQKLLFKDQQLILNVTIITLVLAVVLGGLAFYSLLENRKINKKLEANNKEILSQRNQLIEMSEKAKLATEAKLNFFTNMSHEFRTPLTLILSPLEDLLKEEKIKVIAGTNLKLIHKNVFRLLRLINQLIEYRKIEYEQMKIKASPNNLVAFVKEITDSFQHNAKKNNIDLRFISPQPELMVWFDANMLDKVIFNLLSNALKFTGTNGIIVVAIKQLDEFIYVEVEDNGAGMTSEEATHVFEHFYQTEAGSTKGSGLGLSLSKELMRLHHGNIVVESVKGKGTKFRVSLLSGEMHFSPEEKRQERLDKKELYEHARIYTTDLDEPEETTTTNALSPLKEQSVLIIEDNPDLRSYLSRKLSVQYEVFTANTGEEGLIAAYQEVPDLILSDVVLPGISGKELTEKLKSDLRTSHIPIILLTAQGSVAQQINGMESMADAYIVKPFNYEYLLANVRNLLKTRELLKAHYTSDISSSGKMQVSKSLDKKFLNDFAGIVEENLGNENFSVDDISKAIGISRVQLYRKVKALLDCSITDYILSRRLKKASYLLINENFTIAEITYMVGFSTPNYFSTVFKAKYGCSPSEFKKKP
ncbi:hybrid sensor histidine kinase/response regulator transcription factor [Pedobacter nyackensis]|uniref:histidine kinase n=1 Tax=Pedobacter nyackensis TaxID=475255 RepID=A0A1W2F3P2_9SPHI|nr:substrate-binding domain-containing protein [Pedobacter nyackensis]SMD16118.1 monosaccharide ABC transporter substrate-binding protein, CUT2 family [Pedobacter nyackensis]